MRSSFRVRTKNGRGMKHSKTPLTTRSIGLGLPVATASNLVGARVNVAQRVIAVALHSGHHVERDADHWEPPPPASTASCMGTKYREERVPWLTPFA